jgi:hypothetical protein
VLPDRASDDRADAAVLASGQRIELVTLFAVDVGGDELAFLVWVLGKRAPLRSLVC